MRHLLEILLAQIADESVVKYTTKGSIIIEIKPFAEPDGLRDRNSTATTRQIAVEIVVSDTGCGIEPAKLEELFQQFEQVERLDQPEQDQNAGIGTAFCRWQSSVLTASGSTGLGLAVVARTAEQLGGQLRVDSDSEGSRFSCLLPLSLPGKGKGKENDMSNLISSHPGSQTSASEVEDFVSAMSTSHMGTDGPVRGSSTASVLPHQSGGSKGSSGMFHVQGSGRAIRGVRIDEFTLDRPARISKSQTNSPAVEKADPITQSQAPPPHPPPPTITITSSRPQGQLRFLIVEVRPLDLFDSASRGANASLHRTIPRTPSCSVRVW